ncbi:MAG: response regulator transcription factor [Deltaproteobacteria bacterium]|nr:response regulator transcription factor [Deltaproteobacteria bacterium]
MKKLKTLIIDDEELARESLKELLENFEEIEIVGMGSNGFDAVRMVQSSPVDIVFLDIQMPKLDGFDVVSLLGDNTPVIVFVTAYDEFALRAFEVHAVDYILKPVEEERLRECVTKIASDISGGKHPDYRNVLESRYTEKLDRIVIRDGATVNIVPVDEISHIEAQDDYVLIVTRNGSYLKNDTVSNLADVLPARDFVRIHRSFILNINYLVRIEPMTRDSKIAVLKDGTELSVSKTGYSKLIRLL